MIHGPPGTGKTLTLVEAILQLYRTRKESRILVCASSNSVTDYILERILATEEGVAVTEKIFLGSMLLLVLSKM